MATIEKPAVERRFEHLVLDFLAYLEFERGLSRNTLDAYRSDLLQYGRFLEERERSALDATPATCPTSSSSSRSAARRTATCRPAPRHRRPRSTARAPACARFYRHLRRDGLLDTDPTATLSAPRRTRKLPQVLTRGEIEKLLSSRAAPSRPRCATARCSS